MAEQRLAAYATEKESESVDEARICANFSRKTPHKIVLQPHYMRKMEPTFPMAVRLSVSPIPPFLIPTCGTIGDSLRALLKALRSSVLFGAFTGSNLLDR